MKRLTYLIFLSLVMLVSAPAAGKDPDIVVPDPVLVDIAESYMPWQSAEFNGKLRCDRLPLSPTVRIYMECDSLVQISLRAPLVGEVGRLELSATRFTAVNKLKRTYCSEETSRLLELYPGLIRDIQNLLLARVVVFGSGPLGHDNLARVEVEEDREGGWMLIPEVKGNALSLKYGYIVGAGGRTRALAAALPGKGDLEVKYDYPGRGETIDIRFDNGRKKPLEATLDFTSVKWGGSKMPPLKLDNYSRMSVKEFMQGLGK